MEKHEEIVRNKMMANDAFSQWLGIEIKEIRLNYCRLQMTVRKEMTNGFGIAHGGISYSFADSALAFASNSSGEQSVSIETSISHVKRIEVGDVLIAEAQELVKTGKTGIYEVKVTKQDGTIVALFKGTVYRSGKLWE
jgi:acyl-CoA thioesterase